MKPTWKFEVPKCSKYRANERLKCQNVASTMQNGRRKLPNVANTMQNAKWPGQNVADTMQNDNCQFQIVCKYKADGTRKESQKKYKAWAKKRTKTILHPLSLKIARLDHEAVRLET